MKIIYTALITLSLTSCVLAFIPQSSYDYLGATYTPTDSVAVFVDAAAINRPYTIIGKAYPKNGYWINSTIKQMQKESITKAKAAGADAVLIQDYVVTAPSVNTVQQTDSLGKGTITIANTSVHQNTVQRFNIYFLKYK